MAKNWIICQYDDAGYPTSPVFALPLTNAGGVVKASPGRLIKVIVTTTFAGASGLMTFYDNASAASGVALLAIPTGTAAGTIYSIDPPAVNGIFAGITGTLSAGAVTVGYS
jgi:hypothetical protein